MKKINKGNSISMRYCDVGYDVDGVLADGFVPQDKDFSVISGRHTDDWERTISQVGIKRPIYLRPPNFPGESGEWKAAVILALGIRKFFEDDRNQADVIRRICPFCEIHLVRNGKVVAVMKGA